MTAALPHPNILFTIVSFIVVIALLVTVHEFGHYLAGRWFGVKAETFSIGFGKELLGFTDRRGTRWKVSALPLGGYVKFAGDMNAASMPADISHLPPQEQARTLNAKPLWQKAVIIAAGPLTNFLFAVLVYAGLFMSVGREIETPLPSIIGEVAAHSPAAAAGLRAGDRITAVDGVGVTRFDALPPLVARAHGQPVRLEIVRGQAAMAAVLTPALIDGPGGRQPRLGIAPAPIAQRYERLGPLAALAGGVVRVAELVPMMADGLWQVIAGRASFSEMGGPIKIAQISGQAASLGAGTFASFIAIVSINLGFINLLPIPVLDGGHLAMYALQGVRRRPLSKRAQELAFMSGFAALFTFMIAKTVDDLGSFGLWHRLAGLIG